jgi:hypothetical protein
MCKLVAASPRRFKQKPGRYLICEPGVAEPTPWFLDPLIADKRRPNSDAIRWTPSHHDGKNAAWNRRFHLEVV